MKKLFTILVVLLFTATIFAESPQKMSYQAVIRNVKGELVQNHTIGMKISIYYYMTKTTTKNVYVETQTPTTNENGLASIEIGTGNVVSGVFADINWSSHLLYIKTEIDISGGTKYLITSDTQLLSVPYAFHAITATHLKYKSIPLNIYGAFLPDDKATFEKGFGINSCILFAERVTPTSSFCMNFTLPQDYISGTPIKIRILVSATATGVVDFRPNAISILRAGIAPILGIYANSGLTIDVINITTSNILQEVFGYITSPVETNPIQPEDVITFNFFRVVSDANTGDFKIHGIEIRY